MHTGESYNNNKMATTTLNYTTSTESIKEYFQTHINITVLIIMKNKLASDKSKNSGQYGHSETWLHKTVPDLALLFDNNKLIIRSKIKAKQR